MPKFSPVSYKQLVKVFETEGFRSVRTEGDHMVFTKPGVTRPVMIPTYASVASWRQGSELRGHKVAVPEIKSRRVENSNEYVWEERDDSIRLPVEPDALFTLRFPDRPPQHFCYEADRGSMPMADMLKKFRAYHHFVKRQQKHKEAFGVHPIRAVLIETTDEPRARKLMELAQSPAVIGTGKRSALFWFIISALFAGGIGVARRATYLQRPETILDREWALPDMSLHSLCDSENATIDRSRQQT